MYSDRASEHTLREIDPMRKPTRLDIRRAHCRKHTLNEKRRPISVSLLPTLEHQFHRLPDKFFLTPWMVLV
jgi:hypothetical protein